MKRILTIVLCICMLLLGACTPNQANNTQTNGANTSGQEAENGNPDLEDAVMTIVNADGTSDYRIVYSVTGKGKDHVSKFIAKIEETTGKRLDFYPASTDEKEKEILIGCVDTREAGKTVLTNVSYTDYQISVVGEKIVVAAYEDSLLSRALEDLSAALLKQEDGTWGIKRSFTASGSKSAYCEIPTYETKGALMGIYKVGDQNYEAYYQRTTVDEFAAYSNLLASSGYTLYAQNEIGNNKFVTYTKDSAAVRVAWYASKGQCRIVYGPQGYLPNVTAPNYTAVATPTVAQLARQGVDFIYNGSRLAAGLSLVTQLADGSFIVIDGGYDVGNDKADLYAYLNDNKPASHSKPRVTWMITHLHGDHIQLATSFLSTYSNQIDLEMVCYNFPAFGSITVENESVDSAIDLKAKFLSVLSSKYPNTTHYIYHAGDKLLLPGCEIEFLFTSEDFWPNGFRYINQTSGAWRMKIQNKTLLITGDIVDAACTWVADVYGSALKSDILQVTHHGYNGGTVKLYQLVNPTVCLWPAPAEYLSDITYNPYVNHDYNRYLLDNYDRHYHADEDTVLIFSDLSVKS